MCCAQRTSGLEFRTDAFEAILREATATHRSPPAGQAGGAAALSSATPELGAAAETVKLRAEVEELRGKLGQLRRAAYFAVLQLRESEAENAVLRQQLSAQRCPEAVEAACSREGDAQLEALSQALAAATGAQSMLQQELVSSNARARAAQAQLEQLRARAAAEGLAWAPDLHMR